MFNDAVQDIVRKGSWSKSVMLGRFNHVFMVPDNGFELLLDFSVFCGRALMMSRNSSSDPSMMERVTSVTDLVIDLNGSSCWASSWS